MADRIAVTGAGGFVGRHLVRAATRSGLQVVGIVRSEAGAQVVAQGGGVPVQTHGLESARLEECFAGVDAVVHLAQIGVEWGGETFEAVNVHGTGEVLLAARRVGVARLVFFSGLGVASYGLKPRTTNAYFLSKLAAEVAVHRGPGASWVFRPSYIIGPGDGLSSWLLSSMASGEVMRPGDGAYRLQPVALADASAAVLAALERPAAPGVHGRRVWDLVGPEGTTFDALIDGLGRLARERGLVGDYRVSEVAVEEAERQARRGSFHGMGPEELDCLLCDEVADPAPLRDLLGRELVSLDEAMASALPPQRS